MEIMIDNFMFEYLTSSDGFTDAQYLLNQYKMGSPMQNHQIHAACSPVLNSPKSPITRLPASPVLSSTTLRPKMSQKMRTSSLTDSSLLYSSGKPRIQQFYFEDKSQIVSRGKRLMLYHQVPFKIKSYQKLLLDEIAVLCQNDMINIDTIFTPSQKLIDQRHDLDIVFESFFTYRSKDRKLLRTMGDFIAEEILNVPKCFIKHLQSLYPIQFQCISSFQQFFAQLIDIPPQKRFYRLLGDIVVQNDNNCMDQTQYQISLEHMFRLIEILIDNNTAWDFVQPENYRKAFCETAAVQLLYECNFENWSFDFTNSIKNGIDLLYDMWCAAEREDVAEEPGFLGYEQFYVLYCLFARYGNVQFLKQIQLCSYNEFCYSVKCIERVFQGYGHGLYSDYVLNTLRSQDRRFDSQLQYDFSCQQANGFQYYDFIFLVLADTCIDNYNACRFWFKIADLDSDGFISEDDFLQFVNMQQRQWERKNMDITVSDVKMQFTDMVNQDFPLTVDLVFKSRMHQNLFDCMFSVNKFEQFETRDAYVANPALQDDNGFGKSHFESKVWAGFWVTVYDQLAAD